MEKTAFMDQVAYCFVPEGSRLVTRDVGSGSISIVSNEGNALVAGAQILRAALEESLSDLPEILTPANEKRATNAVLDFFGGVMVGVTTIAVQKMVESQCNQCLARVKELLK